MSLYDGRMIGWGREEVRVRVTVEPGRVAVVDVTDVASGGGGRGKVTKITRDALRRLVRYLRTSVAVYDVFGTLTVRTAETIEGYHHANTQWLATCARRERAIHGPTWSMAWWIEFQVRGVPHTHVLATHALPWRPYARLWAECHAQPDIWQTCSAFERLRGGRDVAAKYASKHAGVAAYAGKAAQKDGAVAGRTWGVRGMRSTVTAVTTATIGVDDIEGLVSRLNPVIEPHKPPRSPTEPPEPPYKHRWVGPKGKSVSLYAPSPEIKQEASMLSIWMVANGRDVEVVVGDVPRGTEDDVPRGTVVVEPGE